MFLQSNGEIFENSMVRHLFADNCPVGALAILMYTRFHIVGTKYNTSPDQTNVIELLPRRNEPRLWYHEYLGWGSKPTEPLSYTQHNIDVKAVFGIAGILLNKTTHEGRTKSGEFALQRG